MGMDSTKAQAAGREVRIVMHALRPSAGLAITSG